MIKKRDLKFLNFFGKPNFWESVTFHCEMFSATNFGIILGFCIVHVMIIFNKYVASLFRISFCEFLKTLILIIYRPCVAEAVLQTPPSLIKLVGQRYLPNASQPNPTQPSSPFPPVLQNIITLKPLELGS